MDTQKIDSCSPALYAGLFDLDGVIIDTEPQYSTFWNDVGATYLNDDSFAAKVKGRVLVDIFADHFAGKEAEQRSITEALNTFEANMEMTYVPGVTDFLTELRTAGFRLAIVTSSNLPKMESVYRKRPELPGFFDTVLTGEQFARGKPFPDCYLLGAQYFGLEPRQCVVFEDSFHGLASGRAAGMSVVGLATTNSAEAIRDKADCVVRDFTGLHARDMVTLLRAVTGTTL